MSQNYEGHPEGDWEDRGDLSWNEHDWQQFLLRQSQEISRFITYYDQHFMEADRLDRAASRMGWELDDWAGAEPPLDDDEEDDTVDWQDAPLDDLHGDPYTLHRHPVFVVSSGIYAQLRYTWEVLLHGKGAQLDARLTWKFAQSLSAGELHIVLALQSLDMGDYYLAVVHLKWFLRALNDTLTLLPMAGKYAQDEADFLWQMRQRCFDLREVALRLMADCREEERRGFRDSD